MTKNKRNADAQPLGQDLTRALINDTLLGTKEERQKRAEDDAAMQKIIDSARQKAIEQAEAKKKNV